MATQALLVIVIVLVVLVGNGVPVSLSIGIAALTAILQTVPLNVAVLTGAQRTFVGMSTLL